MDDTGEFKQVKLPNGKIAQFPASMSWSTIEGHLANQFPDENNAPQEQSQNHADGLISSWFGKMKDKLAENEKRPHSLESAANMSNQGLLTPLKKEDYQNAAGLAVMGLAPEVPIIPAGVRAAIAEWPAIAKYGSQIAGSVGKSGLSSYLGSKIMPNTTEEEAQKSGLVAGGITAGLTPLMMAAVSQNPFVRYLAGGALGAAGGYAGSNITGHPAAATTIGGLLGTMLSGGKNSNAQMAAMNAAESMAPKNAINAAERIPAAENQGIQLSMPEATGSPIHEAMYSNAAKNPEGAKVLYPWAINRENQEQNAYQGLLNKVSPTRLKGPESAAYEKAFNIADRNGIRVDVNSVVNDIDKRLYNLSPDNDIAKSLMKAKAQLSPTIATMEQQNKMLAPVVNMENQLNKHVSNLQNQIGELEKNAPEPYFRASTGYDQKVNALKNELKQSQNVLDKIGEQKQVFMQHSKISNYENTVRGLNDAKKGIRSMIERKGEDSIGATAAGELKQVNGLLNDKIKEVSSEYAVATHMANMRSARNAIQKEMAKTDLSGNTFYNRVLQNKDEYDALYQRLADPKNPKKITSAQEALYDLRTAMPDLMDNLTKKSGKALADKTPGSKFDLMGLANKFAEKAFMNRYQKSVAELMIDPNWQQKLAIVAKMKKGEDRGIALSRLISNVAVTGSRGYMQSQGSERNGTER